MEFSGKVKSGFGNASFWVEKINKIFEEKYQMKLFFGTLNIELENEIVLENKDDKGKILASEYGGDFDILVKECEIFGAKAYIVRTEKNNQKGGDHPLNIVEIVSSVNFRKLNHLRDHDEVTLKINT